MATQHLCRIVDNPSMLDHERLDVYQCAIQFVATMLKMLSIPLNIAEGSGKVTQADRRRFHAIARGSAMECGAILDVIALLDPLPLDQIAEAKALLVRIVSMLSKMCR